MTNTLFGIIILLLLTITVYGQDHLPQTDACGTVNPDYYYNQKNLTQIGEFPWMGRVLYVNKTDDTYWFRCYAILFSKSFVVLNAKCFDFEVEPVRVVLGDWNRENTYKRSDCDDSGRCAPVPKVFKIEETFIHPNYSSKIRHNDIAMIKLSEPVIYSEFIQPICLPTKDMIQMDYANQLLEVTGWYLNKKEDTILAKTFVRVVNINTCESRLQKLYKVQKEKSICALSCHDDYVFEGSCALMGTTVVNEEPVNYYLIGLGIFAQPKCSLHNPRVYSRVDRYLDWIYDNVKGYDTSLIMPRQAKK